MCATSQAWRIVNVGEGFEDGINFYDAFHEDIVNHALATLQTEFEVRRHPCYCLRLDVNSDDQGYFYRFGKALTPDGIPELELPREMRIPLEALVADYWNWPVLAVREGPPPLADFFTSEKGGLFDVVKRVSWRAQFRLQQYDSYVGYFELLGLDGANIPNDHQLCWALYKTKQEVARLLSIQRIEKARTSEAFNDATISAVKAVDSDSPTHA